MRLSSPSPSRSTDDVRATVLFFSLACLLTWSLALPTALAWLRHQAPPPYAVACAGLSAFGPLLAALVIAARQRRIREMFGRWRARPGWILLSLAGPALGHLAATALFWAVGGHPTRWLHPPSTPEAVAALVVFPLGEEFGWRGFAYPRLVARFGVVRGALVLGVGWALWHLAYSVTPQRAAFDVVGFLLLLLELPLFSVILAWLFERADRSLAVAIAFHAGAHLDHFEPATRDEMRLQGVFFIVLAATAAAAAWALRRQPGSLVAKTPD